MNIRELVREDIRDLIPYEPHPFGDVIKMDANENPHLFPPEIAAEIFGQFVGEAFTRYPDPAGQDLKSAIAEFNGVKPENIVLGNGSDELIQLILQTFGGPGKRVVIPVPTFSMYKIHGQITGTQPVEVARDEAFGLRIDELLAEIKHPDTRVAFLATPNNPTGNCVSLQEIATLAGEASSLVVADEAYIDFGGETCLPLLKEYPNLVVLRTFSKIGLAGMRVGYLIAHPDVTRELLKVKQPYNVNTFSQKAALAALGKWPLIREQIEKIISERERLELELGKIPGIRIYPSKANFILFSVPVPAADLHQRLVDDGVLVRKNLGATHGLQSCLRVTVGTKQENDIFLEKMNKNLDSWENQ